MARSCALRVVFALARAIRRCGQLLKEIEERRRAASSLSWYCMDALRVCAARCRAMGVLPHVKKLDDALGDFIVRVTCACGASRHIESEALARIAGRSATLAEKLEAARQRAR
jgi:hypothetical protein